ncbi:MAG: DUF3626 domain-containing protein [Planctomycetota bacterium]|nr:DUF3626 domain-containing protein [Planctomycetota bacterium]
MFKKVSGQNTVSSQQISKPGVGSIGSHSVTIGKNPPLRLDKIKGASIPFQGFLKATKITRSNIAVEQNTTATLKELSKHSPDPKLLLAHLKSYQTSMNRLVNFQARQGHMDQLAKEAFGEGLKGLSNTELAASYQSIISKEIALLKLALEIEVGNDPFNVAAADALSNLYVLEAAIINEVVLRTVMHEARDAVTDDKDMSARNLHTMTVKAALGDIHSGKATEVSEAKLKDMLFTGIEPREIGDVLRNSELTMNLNVNALFKDEKLIDMDERWQNIFHINEDTREQLKGKEYTTFRDSVERNAFPSLDVEDLHPDERPTYAAINTRRGMDGQAANYGGVIFVLKKEVAKRSTYTLNDTFKAVPMNVTKDKINAFYDMLAAIPEEKVPAGFREDLRNEESLLRKSLDGMFQTIEANGKMGKALPIVSFPDIEDILVKYTAVAKNDKGMQDADIEAFNHLAKTALFETFKDPDAMKKIVATYDTLENLLPFTDELDGAKLARMAISAKTGENTPVKLGDSYFEAQIHGGFIPKRDVAEIRFQITEFTDRKKNNDIDIDRLGQLVKFAKENGIPMTAIIANDDREKEYTDILEGIGIEVISSKTYDFEHGKANNHDFKVGKEMRQTHPSVAKLKEEANKLIENDDMLLERLETLFKEELKDITDEELRAIGMDARHKIPLGGAALAKVRNNFSATIMKALRKAETTNEIVNADTLINDLLREAAGEMLATKFDLMNEVAKLEFDAPDHRVAFGAWVMNAGDLNRDEMRTIYLGTIQFKNVLKDAAGDQRKLLSGFAGFYFKFYADLHVARPKKKMDDRDWTYSNYERVASVTTSMLAATDRDTLVALRAFLTSKETQDFVGFAAMQMQKAEDVDPFLRAEVLGVALFLDKIEKYVDKALGTGVEGGGVLANIVSKKGHFEGDTEATRQLLAQRFPKFEDEYSTKYPRGIHS